MKTKIARCATMAFYLLAVLALVGLPTARRLPLSRRKTARSAPVARETIMRVAGTTCGIRPTARSPAGGATKKARPRHRPAPSTRSAQAATTPAGSRRRHRSLLGGHQQRRRPGHTTEGAFTQVSAGSGHTCGIRTTAPGLLGV